MKLSNRLSTAVTGASAVALLVSFVTVYAVVRQEETHELDLALAFEAHALARHPLSSDPTHPAILDGVAHVPESLRPIERYIALYDVHGRCLSATRNLEASVPKLDRIGVSPPLVDEVAFELRVGGIDLRGIALAVGDHGNTLLYAASRGSVDDDARFLRRTLALLFLGTLIATGLFSRWLGGRLAADVRAIGHVARAVAKGDFDARVGSNAIGSDEAAALAADLDHMIEQLGAVVASQRVFVSYAAHELRSPLSTLRGELQLALRRPRDAEDYQRTIANVLSDVDALARLAEDLLTLARVQARAPAVQTVLLDDVVREALRSASGPAASRHVTLIQLPSDPALHACAVFGSQGDLARALRNLIDNAVAHSHDGDSVTLVTQLNADHVQVIVQDQGPGVPTEEAAHLFEPFYRGSSDQSGARSGAGLGLPIALEIARNAGGDVWLDQAQRVGARFVLSLRIA